MTPAEIIEKFVKEGLCWLSESSDAIDENGCFEIGLCSDDAGPDCGDQDCCDPYLPDTGWDDQGSIEASLAEVDCELVDFGDAVWEGYSCYTPDPGGIRRILVRQIKDGDI